ncbi:MAG: hypothetical protein WA945_00070 [Arcobacteraceae bacterium]
MKVLNNYNELILSIQSNDSNRFENLLGYSDCRDDLILRYVNSFGVDAIYQVSQRIKAIALKRMILNLLIQYRESIQ